MSLDKSKIVYVKRTGRLVDVDGPFPLPKTFDIDEIWITNPNGTESHRVLSGPIQIEGREVYAFRSPQISPDNRYAFFLIDYSATTGAVVRLTLHDGLD